MYTVPFYRWTLVSCLYLSADESYYKKKVNVGHAIPFSTSRGKMQGCETCTLSPSIDGHWSNVSIFLLTKVITKRMLILDMQFHFLSVGVKWKVVKNVHCLPLLIDTGLMSIGPLTKKLLQKHHPVSYSKKRVLPAWCTLRRLVHASAYYMSENCETWPALTFSRSHCLDFFLGKSIWSYCRLSLNGSRISKTKPT